MNLSRRAFLGGALAVPVVAAAAPLDAITAAPTVVRVSGFRRLYGLEAAAARRLLQHAQPLLILDKWNEIKPMPNDGQPVRFRRPVPFRQDGR